jgi:hypothetical protein
VTIQLEIWRLFAPVARDYEIPTEWFVVAQSVNLLIAGRSAVYPQYQFVIVRKMIEAHFL